MLSLFLKITGLLSIVIFLIIIGYLYQRFRLLNDIPFFKVNKIKNKFLTIGIIGDSWATFNKLDPIIHRELLNSGFENKIISSGQSGAKTRLIYKNLFKHTTIKNSSKVVIENNPDYCIVFGGVNDAIGQMGANYYSFHLIKIIKFLLHFNIIPIIITLPRIGIKESHESLNFFQRYRNLISVRFNNNGKIENIESYRKKLVEKLKSEKLKDKILLIDFDKACNEFKDGSDLYKNSLHLSTIGNQKLGYFIAHELIKVLKTRGPLLIQKNN